MSPTLLNGWVNWDDGAYELGDYAAALDDATRARELGYELREAYIEDLSKPIDNDLKKKRKHALQKDTK